MLISLARLVAQDVDNLHLPSGAGDDLVQLVLQEYALRRPAAIKDGEPEILDTVRYRLGHGVEGSYTASARQGHDGPGVAYAVIVEVAQRSGYIDPVALFPVLEYPLRGKAGPRELDRQNIARAVFAQRGAGAGTYRIGLRERRPVYVEVDAHILAGPEIRQAFRAALLVRYQREALGLGVLLDLCYLHMLDRRVQALRQAVGVEFGHGQVVRRCGDALVAHGHHGEEAGKGDLFYLASVVAVFHLSGPPSCP